ncbi:MAG: nucleotidyl transferase AbiEii/AbiGii toxin family protein [Desulfobulbus sp.]|nr:nucleotidyl transferase AbiEii/AbiGii toxin family protein [Desulfobulbus sp.]
MPKFNIKEWVEADPDQAAFRQAVHTILTAISGTPFLKTSMIMKGGVLLALGYSSARYTQDIDFSTAVRLPEFDQKKFQSRLAEGLVFSSESLGYGLDCRIQGIEQKPAREDASFPTIQTKIGYARKGDKGGHRRLLAGQATKVVKLDYSLNEPVGHVDLFELEDGNTICTYGIIELISEKFRALLQQQVRDRMRGQDVYDLYHLFTLHPDLVAEEETKQKILERLIEKSASRSLSVCVESLANVDIRRRTEEDYKNRYSEIEEGLPPFHMLYESVERYYRSLPWLKIQVEHLE